MKLDDKELDIIIEKKVDRIIYYSENKPVLDLQLGKLVQKRFEEDPNLKRQVLRQVLESES